MDEESARRTDDTVRRAESTVGRAAAPDPSVRSVLAAERLRTLALCRSLRHDLDSLADAQASSNADDEHDPEGATLAFERAQTAALLDQSRSRLEELDKALQRHEQGTYGICEMCGEAIPAERLAVRPTAQTCLRCAT
jgi:DnaK suppressor protein